MPDDRHAVLEARLRHALVRLNPDLDAEAFEDALRKLMRTDAPSLLERNRALYGLLVDVTIEHCDAVDRVRGLSIGRLTN